MKLNEIVITKIHNLSIISSPSGKFKEMKNRKYYGLSFCIKGQITYTQNGKRFISTKSNAVLLPKGGHYTFTSNADGLFPIINFDGTGINCDEITLFSLQNAEPFIQDFNKLSELFLYKNNQLLIFSIFYDMLRRLAQEQVPQNDILYHAINFIKNNISNPELSNLLISQNINISEVYLRKLFAAKYNTSPKQYILDMRIQKAKHLLANSPYSITAIGTDCGFSSVYIFSRCFKNRVGISPNEYAKINRKFEL